jgi:MATE family multidrug resistance protein
VAAAFQLFDGVQVVAFGVLRGAGDVRVPSVLPVVGFWLLGLPIGAWLAFRGGLGAVGIWIGLTIGLGALAALLVVRVAQVGRQGGIRVAFPALPPPP